jgi:hypothetical protein
VGVTLTIFGPSPANVLGRGGVCATHEQAAVNRKLGGVARGDGLGEASRRKRSTPNVVGAEGVLILGVRGSPSVESVFNVWKCRVTLQGASDQPSPEGTNVVQCRCLRPEQEGSMSDNKNPAKKRPGEKEPGKFHYNPGNQSGKTAEKPLTKPESELENNRDRTESRTEEPPKSR